MITRLLMTVNVLIFGYMLLVNPELNELYALDPARVVQEPYLIFSSMFLHANGVHLLSNMFALSIIGSQLEKNMSSVKFLALYMISGVVGSIVYLATMPGLPAVGASGAIFGLLGFALPYTGYSKQVVGLVALNGFISFMPGIAWQAHLGGLVTGWILGYFWFTVPMRKLANEPRVQVIDNRPSSTNF